MKKQRNRTGLRLTTVIVILIFGVVSYKRISLAQEYKNVKAQEIAALQTMEQEKERTKALENERVYRNTKQYIEEIAREKLGLVYKDEIIFKPNQD